MPQFHTLRSYKNNGGGLLSQQRKAVSGSVVSSVIVEAKSQPAQLVEQETQRQPAVPQNVAIQPRGALLLPPGVAKMRTTRNLQQTTGTLRPQDPSTTGVQIEHITRNLQMMQQGTNLPVPVQPPDRYVSLSLPVRYSQVRPQSLRAIAFVARGKSVLIIPGKRQRTRETDALSVHATHHLSIHLRHSLMLLATVCIFAFCMITMTPLNPMQQGVFSQRWVDTQKSWDINSPQSAQSATVQGPYGSEEYYRSLARADALKYGISPYYYERQIQQESHFDPNARSEVGAIGIAQFMPETAREYGFDPTDPVAALDGGARFMSNLNSMFNGDYRKALAAYNAGPGAVDNAVASCGAAWLSCMDGQPQAYVYIIMGY
jgi:Soluble lytic murein transglycosylase and related regulatory proteins (some contain LysM/invasin domains)